MKMKLLCLTVLVVLGGCTMSKEAAQAKWTAEAKQNARYFADGGEWVVKYTNNDPGPQGPSFGSPCGHCDADHLQGMGIMVSKKTDQNNYSENKGFCILNSHPQYGEFARLHRGERVQFELTDTPIQPYCSLGDEGMFLRLKR